MPFAARGDVYGDGNDSVIGFGKERRCLCLWNGVKVNTEPGLSQFA